MGCLKIKYDPVGKTLAKKWKIFERGLEKKGVTIFFYVKTYRYGFNGHERDDEIKGSGNHLSFGDQGYDPRLGRRWNIDPVDKVWESPYATFRNNPLIYADPDGNDGILVVFPDYKVDPELEVTAWGKNFKAPKLPLGHAGVLLIDNETGLTKYYEFGRYPTDDGTKGKVRNISVPNVIIDPETGKPTQESLNKVLGVISDKAGHKGRIEGAYVEGDFDVMNDFAQEKLKESNPQYGEYDKDRAPYDLYDNNCGTFGCDVLKQDEAAAKEAPWIFNPTPDNVSEEYQDNFPKVNYDPKTKTTTSDIYKKKD